MKFRKSQWVLFWGFWFCFLTTQVCESGVALGYIDLFIKLLLLVEKAAISLLSYFCAMRVGALLLLAEGSTVGTFELFKLRRAVGAGL